MTYPKGSATVGEHFSLHYSNSYPTCRQWDIQDNYTAQHIYIYIYLGWLKRRQWGGMSCNAMECADMNAIRDGQACREWNLPESAEISR